MRLGRLFATAFLVSGAFCPVGAHALAHAVNSAHVHGHDDGTVHAHEHDAEGHHEPEQRCSDDAPRLADSGARLLSGRLAQHPISAVESAVVAFSPRPVVSAILDPPLLTPQCLAAPSAAGRAPPP